MSVISEAKKPGATELTRMPLRPVHCWARSRVRPLRPALLAEYAACGSPPVVRPSTEVMLMIEEPGRMTRPQAWAIQ